MSTLRGCLLISLVALGLAPTTALSAESPVELVEHLYAKYAWEAADTDAAPKTPFVNAPRAELLRYLEPGLADALLRDGQCASRTKQVCQLDFSPLWASQDPGASDLRVQQGPGLSKVTASFAYPGHIERDVLRYELLETEAGPRIRDILYTNGSSLRRILKVR